MRADGDIQAVVILVQLFKGDVFSDRHFGMYLHAGGQNGGNLRVQLFAREAVGRDAVAEHAAEPLLFFKNRHAVAHKAQIIRAGKPARAAADDGDAFAGRLPAGRIRDIARMIDCIALEAPDIDGRVDHVAAAARLARVLADVRAGGRHGVILADKTHRVGVPSLAHQRDIARHVHARRTERHAGHGVLKRGEAPVVLHMVHIVVPEALKAAQDQLRCVASDGAVSRGDDGPRRFFDGVDGQHGARSVEHLPHQRGKLAESNAAGHAFAARLRVAQLQKCQRHIDRTQARGAGRDPAFHVLVEAVDDRLGLACGFDIQSAQGWLTPSAFLIFLFYLFDINSIF